MNNIISKFLKNGFNKKKTKITVLVAIQILIILGSFLIITQFTIQSEYIGNSINLSSSNRFLAEILYENTDQYLLHAESIYNIVSVIDTNLSC